MESRLTNHAVRIGPQLEAEGLREDLPDLDDQLAHGETAPLLAWLRERIHRPGRLYQPAELIERATGSLPEGGSPAGRTSARVTRLGAEPAIDSSDPAAGIVSGASVRRVTDATDPYAPVGIRVGSFIYYPAVTVGAGFTTNAEKVPGSGGSPTVNISPELLIQSDWARHEASFSFKGDWEHFINGAARDNPS